MELGLSLGDSSKPSFKHLGLGLNTTLSIGPTISTATKSCDHHNDHQKEEEEEEEEAAAKKNKEKQDQRTVVDHHQHHEATNRLLTPAVSLSSKPINNSLQLDLLPPTPVLPLSTFPWPLNSDHGGEVAASSRLASAVAAAAGEEDESEERAALSSSPNSAASSFQVDLFIYSRGGTRSTTSMSGSGNNNNINSNGKRVDSEGEAYYYDHKASSRASDEDDNVGGSTGGTRKKLRLSKEQSSFLEESFKEHSTLNPKQKLALAKQLDLRPRQVEVWFQNRRARTKLKQTEIDCEYLKRCCETLSEENKRLHKELQDLRALKASSSNPFFMQLPATTLTMCPSCERVAPNPTSTTSSASTTPLNPNSTTTSKSIGFPLAKPKFYPFPHSKPHQS